jgi:hypothetical protein
LGKTGFDLMTGVIIFVLVSDELEDAQRNLSTVQAILSDGGPVRELAERLAADKDTEADEKAKIAEGFRAVMEYIRDTGYEKISAGLLYRCGTGRLENGLASGPIVFEQGLQRGLWRAVNGPVVPVAVPGSDCGGQHQCLGLHD